MRNRRAARRCVTSLWEAVATEREKDRPGRCPAREPLRWHVRPGQNRAQRRAEAAACRRRSCRGPSCRRLSCQSLGNRRSTIPPSRPWQVPHAAGHLHRPSRVPTPSYRDRSPVPKPPSSTARPPAPSQANAGPGIRVGICRYVASWLKTSTSLYSRRVHKFVMGEASGPISGGDIGH